MAKRNKCWNCEYFNVNKHIYYICKKYDKVIVSKNGNPQRLKECKNAKR